MIANLTTDPAGDLADIDIEPLRSRDLAREIATFDAGTFTRGDHIMNGSIGFLRSLTDRMRQLDTEPELEIFHGEMISTLL